MDLLVFIVGSLAAILSAWFALQVLFRLILGVIKLSALAALAYFAAQVTWINAEIPEVASAEATALINSLSRHWQQASFPQVNVNLGLPQRAGMPFTKVSDSTEEQQEAQPLPTISANRYF